MACIFIFAHMNGERVIFFIPKVEVKSLISSSVLSTDAYVDRDFGHL